MRSHNKSRLTRIYAKIESLAVILFENAFDLVFETHIAHIICFRINESGIVTSGKNSLKYCYSDDAFVLKVTHINASQAAGQRSDVCLF